MSYAKMDHAEWMARYLKRELTEFEKKVVDILGMVGAGIYNAPINPDKINWKYGFDGISVVWQREMASFDFGQLTMLVFLCHAARIRIQIEGCAPRNMRLVFFQRQSKGDMAIRHPDLQEAVAAFEDYLPKDHRVRWTKEPSQ
jgi:hypothetical protein